jgi:hypothetical protein
MERISHWIGGKAVPHESGRTGPVFNPRQLAIRPTKVDFANQEEAGVAVGHGTRSLP